MSARVIAFGFFSGMLCVGLTGCFGSTMTASERVKQPIEVYVPDGYTAEQGQACVDKINTERNQLERPLVLSSGGQATAMAKKVGLMALGSPGAYQSKFESDAAQLKLDMCMGVLDK